MGILLRGTGQRGAGTWTGDPPALLQATDLCERAIGPGVGAAQGSSASTDREARTLIAHGSSGALYVYVGIVQCLRSDAPGQHVAQADFRPGTFADRSGASASLHSPGAGCSITSRHANC
jgi:hypothetical protein